VSQRRTQEDYKILSDLMEVTWNEIEALAQRGEGIHGVGTGFDDLDNLTHGFQPGQLIIVAARPGVGKSTLAMDFARHAVFKQERTTAFFSLEMSSIEIMFRLLSAETGIDLSSLRKGTLNQAQYDSLARRMGALASGRMYIDDSANLTMMEIRAKARRLKQKNDLQFMVVDYIQLMSSGKKVESRQQEVSEFSRQMKLLAKELEIPIVALSQLNRGPENRSDKRPMLSDLRESGSLEQDADIFILIHKEEAEGPRAGEADLIVAKNRNGQTRDVAVAFQGHRSRFVPLAQS
jgi:replicative DNA helicase